MSLRLKRQLLVNSSNQTVELKGLLLKKGAAALTLPHKPMHA